MAEAAKGNPTAVAQFVSIKEEKVIQCISNQFSRTRAQNEGVLIQTTNNYYKYTLNLLRTISSAVILSYNLISMEMKQVLEEETYDKLVSSQRGLEPFVFSSQYTLGLCIGLSLQIFMASSAEQYK